MLKNRVIYIAVFILSFLYVYFYGKIIPWLLFEMVVAAPLLSLGYLIFSYYHFDFLQKISRGSVRKYETLTMEFLLKNKSALFSPFVKVNVIYEPAAFSGCSKTFFVNIAPLSEIKYEYKIQCLLCGQQKLGIQSLEFVDFFGLFIMKKEVKGAMDVIVLPRLLTKDTINYLQTRYFDITATKKSYFVDPLEIKDIRKYINGDNFRSVHWKISAKKNELYVKNNEVIHENTAIILPDLYFYGSTEEDRLIMWDRVKEYTLSLLYFCVQQGIDLKVIYYENNIRRDFTVSDVGDFETVYQTFARTNLNSIIKGVDLVDEIIKDRITANNLILLTPDASADCDTALLRARANGFTVFKYDLNVALPKEMGMETKTEPEPEKNEADEKQKAQAYVN